MTLSRNFCVLVNFPKQVPRDTRLSRGMLAATFSNFSLRREQSWSGSKDRDRDRDPPTPAPPLSCPRPPGPAHLR